jgi:hypothetical protein
MATTTTDAASGGQKAKRRRRRRAVLVAGPNGAPARIVIRPEMSPAEMAARVELEFTNPNHIAANALCDAVKKVIKIAETLTARRHPSACKCGMCLRTSRREVIALAHVCRVFESLV